MRKEQFGDHVLYCGDAREILPGIKADLIVTDPPYKLSRGGNAGGKGIRMSGKFAKHRYKNDGNIVDCDITWTEIMSLLYDALGDQGHCYTMTNDKNMRRMLNAAHDAKFRFHNLLVWDKATATPNRWYMKNCEYTGLFFKGEARYINNCGSKQLIYVPQEPYGEHPTPKPVMLMRHYIENSSEKGQTVLDPFMGTAPVGVACIESGRKFIGIERDVKFFDVCCKRMEKESALRRQGNLL